MGAAESIICGDGKTRRRAKREVAVGRKLFLCVFPELARIWSRALLCVLPGRRLVSG